MAEWAATSIHIPPKAAAELLRNIRMDDLEYHSPLGSLQQPMTWPIKEELVRVDEPQHCAHQLPSPICQATEGSHTHPGPLSLYSLLVLPVRRKRGLSHTVSQPGLAVAHGTLPTTSRTDTLFKCTWNILWDAKI
jgi:hypothetical protein